MAPQSSGSSVSLPLRPVSVARSAHTVTGTMDNVNEERGRVLGAAAAGAQWTVAQDILPATNRNAVSLHSTSLALQDERRPNDRTT